MLNQREDRKLQLARVNQLAFIIVVLFVLLCARLWYLQIAQGEDLLKQSESNRIKLLRMRAPRGTILDRKGKVLATSRPQFVVLAIPEMLNENKEALHTLCGILKITPSELNSIIKKGPARPGSPVRVAIDVPMDVVARIGELRMVLPGVSVELDNIRYYPDGPAVAHIMGKLGEINQDALRESKDTRRPYQPGDYIGVEGLEKQYENLLRGTDGGKRIEVNAFGRAIRILGEKQSIPGKTLKLSIDRDCQVAAYRAMGKQVGAVVAIDPRTGAVLTMVSTPAYDPNLFVKRLKSADWDKIIHNKQKPLQNRAVYNVYPPGSTFKPIMAIAGLVYNMCDIHTTVHCPGFFRFGRRFRCWKTHGGGVNFNRAIAESCDVWFYNLGHKLEIDRMAHIAEQFGVGSATGIDLPKESRRGKGRLGTMPSTKWKREVYHERWWPGETISCAIGQGYIETSPLQMAVVCAGVAASGKIYKPFLVDEVVGSDKRTEPVIKREVKAKPEYFNLVQQAMLQTTTNGTGGVANIPGILVGSKTGSAQSRPGRPAHGWFICFAPVDNPQIAIAAIVEHGAHGATTAAPVCRAILDIYFGKKQLSDIAENKAHVSGD